VTEPFVHPQALVESTDVGPGTRVWAFAHVLPGARIGADCNVCDGVFVEGDVVVGDRVTVKGGVQLWDGTRIGDDVFIGPNATFTNDPFPRSRQRPERYAETVVEDGASLGANCTILPGVRIGRRAMVGAGAVVTRSVPPNAIVVGNPARIVGYADAARADVALSTAPPSPGAAEPAVAVDALGVGGAALHRLPLVQDLRGDLSVGEFERDVPFEVARYFLVFNVPSSHVRGEHAHRACHQFLVCVKGSCSVVVDDGAARAEVVLDQPNLGLHVPPLVWATQYKYSPDAVLLVLASLPYDPDDYVRDYDEFRRLLQDAAGGAAAG
jgi:UDP-2-acetamido-3-amino-2,3-dideoxy-glucuronate N-acetyltransferase